MKREEEIAAEEKNARKEKRKQQIQKLEGLVKPSKRQQRSENTTRLEDFDRDMQEQIIAVLRKRKETKISDCGLYVLCIVSFGYLGAYYQVSAKSTREFEELAALKEAGLQSALSGKRKSKYTSQKRILQCRISCRNMKKYIKRIKS